LGEGREGTLHDHGKFPSPAKIYTDGDEGALVEVNMEVRGGGEAIENVLEATLDLLLCGAEVACRPRTAQHTDANQRRNEHFDTVTPTVMSFLALPMARLFCFFALF
jgi:hypothetical protein